MFLLAMPNAEFEDKTYYDLNEPMPLTNVTVYPRTQVKLVLKEPLRVGDVPHQSTEEDDDDDEEEDVGIREAVQPSRPTRDGKETEEEEKKEEEDDEEEDDDDELDDESDDIDSNEANRDD